MGRRGFAHLRRTALIALLCCVPASPARAQAGALPPELRDVGFDQRLDAQIPLDAVFRDESGRKVRLGDYFGRKPVVLALVYYDCPMLCTLILNGMLKALRALPFEIGNEFEVVTISFDPREKPELAAEKKERYVREYRKEGAGAGWHFLTGEEPSIRAVTGAAGFRYAWLPDRGEFAHASGIMVVTPEGRIARYLYGIEYSARDLRLALVEAADNKIGSPVDQVLLYCYHYDPITGKYGLVIMNIIRVLGTVTVIALASFMFIMFRRDRAAPDSPSAGA